MKYGILTIHETMNYGSALQTFGLFYGMKKIGIDVEVIDYRCKKIYENEFFPFRRKNIGRKIILYILYGLKYKYKERCFEHFFHKYIKLSKNKYDRKSIVSDQVYDAYIIGSDMVWNIEITGNDYTYFLDFVNEKENKFAFSASAGDFTTLSKNNKLLHLIDDFSYISMREKSAAEYLSSSLSRKVKHLQDPTILLDKMVLNSLAVKPRQKDYVLVYYSDLDGKIFTDAKQYAHDNNLKIYYINIGKKRKGINNVYVPSIEKFLGLIKYAKAIFTSSYHGMLFSIYYNKEFWYYNNSQISRMKSVAESYNICGRNGSESFSIENSIDYKTINEQINNYRRDYFNEIKQNLDF